MNRVNQSFSFILLALHLGMPVVLQADHSHFLGMHWNAAEQLETDSCCPSESHNSLDSTDRCTLCQRGLTFFGILAVCSAIPQSHAVFPLIQFTSPDRSSQYSLCVPLRGPPFLVS